MFASYFVWLSKKLVFSDVVVLLLSDSVYGVQDLLYSELNGS